MNALNRPDLKAARAYAKANQHDADNPAIAEAWEHAREWARTQPEGKDAQAAVDDAQAAVDKALSALKAAADAERNELSKRHLPPIDTTAEIMHLARIIGELQRGDDGKGLTMGNVYDYALAWADRQTIVAKLATDPEPEKPAATEGAKANATGKDKTRRKVRRPDNFTDADDKIISALLEHHEYDSPKDGGFSSVLNTAPATYDLLCDKSGVKSKDTIYSFFGKWFPEGGNDAYKRACKGGTQKLGLEIARLIPGDVPTFDRRLYIDREA